MNSAQDRRSKHPSITTPVTFESLELILIWIVFGIFEGTVNITTWSPLSYALGAIWVLYTIYKLTRVISRQNGHKF